MFHQFRREVRAAQERAEAAISLATEQGFPHWRAQGAILRGWVLAQQGQAQAGIAQIHQGLSAYRATGAEINTAVFSGAPRRSLWNAWDSQRQDCTCSRKRWHSWTKPENAGTNQSCIALKATLLLQQSSDNHTEAETCFHQALDIARSQQAKSLELRAATSLARLWQQQGKRQEAHDLLAPVYGWFTEGFDTADLQEAKALLEALA